MKIAAVSVRPVTLRFARPVRTARGEFTERACVLLQLHDEDGRVGFGEAAPWPGFATERNDEAVARLGEISTQLVGADPEPGAWTEELAQGLRAAPAARAALQGALCDLAARRAGRPLADCLAAAVGAPVREPLRRVPASVLLTADEPAALREQAARARAAGHRAVKIKLGSFPLAEDVERARAVREAAGPELALRGDANGAWSERAAMAALESLAPFGFEYVEQPLAPDDIAGLARLRKRSPVRIAADESVASEQGALHLIELQAVDVVVLKPATLGGPLRALEVARQARAAGIGVVFSHTFESAVGARHALHCAAAWGDATAVHGVCTAGLFAADVAEPVACEHGQAEIADQPGIGITP